jgi:hypothetical protein
MGPNLITAAVRQENAMAELRAEVALWHNGKFKSPGVWIRAAGGSTLPPEWKGAYRISCSF